MSDVILALAPAKINLGLRVLGRRSDGYHEIDTIMQTVTLFDRVSMTWPGSGAVTCSLPSIPPSENLIGRAAMHLADRCQRLVDVDFHLEKRIPVAAGLGGGSSNAASALRLLARLWGIEESDPRLHDAAAATGSDVPFFLAGGRARATGRGERIEPMARTETRWVVVVSPDVVIERKTATLFAALGSEDFGSDVQDAEHHNAFRRPLYDNFPEIARIADALRTHCDVPSVITGAGPAHYVLLDDLHAALRLLWSARTDERLTGCSIHVARTFAGPGPILTIRNDSSRERVSTDDTSRAR